MELILDKGLDSEIRLDVSSCEHREELNAIFMEATCSEKQVKEKIKTNIFSSIEYNNNIINQEFCLIFIDYNFENDDEESKVSSLYFTTKKDYFLSWEELQEIMGEIKELILLGKQHKIKKNYNEILQKMVIVTENTRALMTYNGFVAIYDEWLDLFNNWVDGRRVLEIGCGCGAVSQKLKEKGCNITAIDNKTWNNRNWFDHEDYIWNKDFLEEDFFQVSKQYKDYEVYLMTYPMHGEFVANVIKRIKDNNSKAKIVIIHQPLEFFDEESKTLMEKYEIQDNNIEALKNCQFSWTGYFNFKTSLKLLG